MVVDVSLNVNNTKEVGHASLRAMEGHTAADLVLRKRDQVKTLGAKKSVKVDGCPVTIDPQLLFQSFIQQSTQPTKTKRNCSGTNFAAFRSHFSNHQTFYGSQKRHHWRMSCGSACLPVVMFLMIHQSQRMCSLSLMEIPCCKDFNGHMETWEHLPDHHRCICSFCHKSQSQGPSSV